jgi:hypothetical protein
MVPYSSEGWRGLRLCRQFEEKGLGVVLTKEGGASIQKLASSIADYRSRWWIHGQGALREPSGGRNGARGKEGNGGDRQPIKLARRNEMEGGGDGRGLRSVGRAAGESWG